jgi:hypothetical protein
MYIIGTSKWKLTRPCVRGPRAARTRRRNRVRNTFLSVRGLAYTCSIRSNWNVKLIHSADEFMWCTVPATNTTYYYNLYCTSAYGAVVCCSTAVGKNIRREKKSRAYTARAASTSSRVREAASDLYRGTEPLAYTRPVYNEPPDN